MRTAELEHREKGRAKSTRDRRYIEGPNDEKTLNISVNITIAQYAWLKTQIGTRSGTIRDLITEKMRDTHE